MTDFFPQAEQVTLVDEGVYSNDPNDPGGETKWGIARKRHPEISDAAWALWTARDSMALYRSGYWDRHRCGDMPWAWALAVFEGEINQGDVIRLLQRCLGLKTDGAVGDVTLKALSVVSSNKLDEFFSARAFAYIADNGFPQYKTGWFNRLFKCRALCAIQPGG